MKTTDREVLRKAAHYLRSVRAQFTGDRWEAEEPAAAELLELVEHQLADTGPAWAPLPKIAPLDPNLATLHPVCSVCGRLIDEDGGCHC